MVCFAGTALMDRREGRQSEPASDKKSIVRVKLHQSMQPSDRVSYQERLCDADGSNVDDSSDGCGRMACCCTSDASKGNKGNAGGYNLGLALI